MLVTQLRTLLTNSGATPATRSTIPLLRQLVTLYGGTPTQYSVIGLLKQAIIASGGTPAYHDIVRLLRQLITLRGGTPTKITIAELGVQLAATGAAAATVGGAALESAGGTGTLYEGYTLSWGDEFTTLDTLRPSNSRGKYFTTRGAYSGTGPRGSDSVLAPMYDTDPYHTGHNDANRGVAYITDTMTVSSSVLALKARQATAGEKTKFQGTRYVAASMISSLGSCVYHADAQGTGDIIIEARLKFSTTNPAGWHPTFWLFSCAPAQAAATDAQSADEHDFEGTGTVADLHRNIWDSGGVVSTEDATPLFTYDNAFHTWTWVLSKSATDGVKLYQDGVLWNTGPYSANTKDKIQQALLTCHADTNGSEAGWTADADGATLSCDWWRIWRRTGKTHYRPLTSISDTNVAFNTATTITLPSAATIWGDGTVTEYLQCVIGEENEPGSNHGTGYVQFPTGVTYDSGTRVITITTALTGTKAGRLNFVLHGYKAGCTAEPLRFALNVGPNINVSTISATTGTAGTYDLYAAIDCGILVSDSSGAKSKPITVTGRPTGVTYDDSTGLLSWTTGIAAGGTTITVNVTNSAGQTASKSVSFVASGGVVTSFTDDFVRSPQTLQNIEASANWTRVDGTAGDMRVTTGARVESNTTSATGCAATAPDLGTADHYVQGRFMTGGSNCFLAARLADANNFGCGVRTANGGVNIQVYSRNAGTLTQLANLTIGFVGTDVYRLAVSGTTWTLKRNGTQVGTGTITGAPAVQATKCGIVVRNAVGDAIDDFEEGQGA